MEEILKIQNDIKNSVLGNKEIILKELYYQQLVFRIRCHTSEDIKRLVYSYVDDFSYFKLQIARDFDTTLKNFPNDVLFELFKLVNNTIDKQKYFSYQKIFNTWLEKNNYNTNPITYSILIYGTHS